MICEYCNKKHSGKYGSSRFCNSICAHGYTTKKKRKEINKKVSKKLKGRIPAFTFNKGYDRRRYSFTKDVSIRGRETALKNRRERSRQMSWEEASIPEKRRRVFEEQNGKCNHCGLEDWNSKEIVLHFEHKDGNHENNKRENVELICPNCHSQTPTYGNKKRADDGTGIHTMLKP